ncbi:MAG: aminotransferase class V-fold PLP-dependent enzyme [Deltaproteobacteria bacterium]|nr:aminotransferase class V-fold PLP-dependent enzyme [Deltaproteobacteria bacterium]
MDPRSLRPHYGAFLRDGRILLTGHSHQAWPDVARAAQLEAFDDAAEHVDHKWGKAFEAADAVRSAVASRIACSAEEVALGASTHELVARFLSALPLRTRQRVVTTRGEFHTIHRQLSRLAEEGVEVVMIDPGPIDSLASRLADALDDRTAAVLVSSVLFETSSAVPHLASLAERARARGVAMLVDAYHAFCVVPFTVDELGGDVFVTAGGYKYAQWGEGNCFLRVPPSFDGRPAYTGWFSDFAQLSAPRDGRAVSYGSRPCDRFAGSTYDPTSHYRARAVTRFFDAHGLDVPTLRAISLKQTSRLLASLEGLDVATPRSDARGGFVSVRVKDAAAIVAILASRGVMTDARGDLLRLGPAPYVTDEELEVAIGLVREVIASRP